MYMKNNELEKFLIALIDVAKIVNEEFLKNKNSNTNKIIDGIKESMKDPKALTANRLSLSRIPLGLMAPIVAQFSKKGLALAAVSSIYAITDFLDGFWSKHVKKHPTQGGAYLDAICDKVGALELIIPAILKNPGLLLNGILEGIISKTNIEASENGKNVKSTKLGKLKMWPLSAAIICTYMSKTGLKFKNFEITKEEFKTMANILIPITAALETINILEYKKLADEKEKELEPIEEKTFGLSENEIYQNIEETEKPKTLTKKRA